MRGVAGIVPTHRAPSLAVEHDKTVLKHRRGGVKLFGFDQSLPQELTHIVRPACESHLEFQMASAHRAMQTSKPLRSSEDRRNNTASRGHSFNMLHSRCQNVAIFLMGELFQCHNVVLLGRVGLGCQLALEITWRTVAVAGQASQAASQHRLYLAWTGPLTPLGGSRCTSCGALCMQCRTTDSRSCLLGASD